MIVSTTLSGNCRTIIEDALLSVREHVDLCLVIDTGITDSTLNVALATVADKLIIRRFPWVNDFSAARNFALQAAAEAGATWALTLDTDERLSFAPGFNLREYLSACNADVLFASFRGGRYMKERIIRTGAGVHWIGPTHEATNEQPEGKGLQVPEITFDELPKDEETKRRNFERDVPLLRGFIEQFPEEPRGHLYLGLSFYNRGLYAEAIEPLLRAAELASWQGEGATACLRAMKSYGALGRWDRAVEVGVRALAARPGAGELQFFLDVARSKARKVNL